MTQFSISSAPDLPPGVTPQLLSRTEAAAYCGVSPYLFERYCPIAPNRTFGRQKRWDVKALRAWLDRESGLATIAVPDGEEKWHG